MKVVRFKVDVWGTRLKNERKRQDATLELWVAPLSHSLANETRVPTGFDDISPEGGWMKVTESIAFTGSGSIVTGSAGTFRAYNFGKDTDFLFKVPDEYYKFAVLITDCNFCRNLGKTIAMSGSFFDGDTTEREYYPYSTNDWGQE